MDKESWDRAVELFSRAVEISPEEREKWLCEYCSDEQLRAEVRSLLDSDEVTLDPGYGVRHVVKDLTGEEFQGGDLSGKIVGAWKLQRQLGAGGMGTVYLADRCDGNFAQQAALKLLNAAMLSPETRLRFKTERQILADLRHPDIAHLIDGGETEEGLPYLVLDYVDGVRVDEYCSENQLGIAQRCALLVTICEAVQYAHNHLVVHRDLKPTNILVEADGSVKLLDFGIAKLLGEESGMVTRSMHARPMTPQYSSPEQRFGGQITTASDVYALGLLMYRLLAGDVPTQSTPGLPGESISQPPSKFTMPNAPAALENRRQHRRRELKGDLDNIVMMALREEPERRYASAGALAEDITRYLNHEPVMARADSWSYRTSKFIRRHRQSMTVASVMIIGLIMTVWFYTGQLQNERDRAQQSAVQAQQEAARANQVSSFLVSIFERADPVNKAPVEMTAVDLLDQAVINIENELIEEPEVRGSLLKVMSYSYRELDQFDKARNAAAASIDALRTAGPGAEESLSWSLIDLAIIMRLVGDYEPALEAVLEAYELAQKPQNHSDLLEWHSLNNMGLLYKETGELALASQFLEKALVLSKKVHGDIHAETADSMNNLAITLMQLGEYEKAEDTLCRAAEIGEQTLPRLHSNLAAFINNCGNALRRLERYEEALQRHQDSYDRRVELNGETSFGTIFCHLAMTYAYTGLGQFESAAIQLQKTRQVLDLYAEPGSPLWGRYYRALGAYNFANGDYLQAADAYAAGLGIHREVLGEKHLTTLENSVELARARIMLDQLDSAEELLSAVVIELEDRFPHDNMVIYPLQMANAELALRKGKKESAQVNFEYARENCRQNIGEQARCMAAPLNGLRELGS